MKIELKYSLMGILFLFFIFCSSANALLMNKVYFGTNSPDVIKRADLDGSNVETTHSFGNVNVSYIDIDVGNDKIYWTQRNTNIGIFRSDLDGSNQETVISGGATNNFLGLALDVAAGKVYWSSIASNSIRRSNLDGSNEEIVISGLSSPADIDLDTVNGKVYWGEFGSNLIRRANLDGSSAETLFDNPTDGIDEPRGLALDVSAGKIYWGDDATNALHRANMDGSGAVEDLITGLASPTGVAIDYSGGYVYFVDFGQGTVNKANLDGSNRVILVSGVSQAHGIAVVNPEPASFLLLSLSLFGFSFLKRKK